MALVNWLVSKMPPRLLNLLFYSRIGNKLVALYEKSAKDEVMLYETKYGVKFYLSAAVPGERAIVYNAFEPTITKLFLSLVSRDSVVLDIGSWVGYYALLAAKQNASQVYAIELDPENVERIGRNVAINGFENIKIVHAGVSNEQGMTTVERRKDSRIMAHVVNQVMADGSVGGDIPVETLDGIASDFTVDLAMVDIEGHELFALQGARKMLEEKRLKNILIEVHPKFLMHNNQSAGELVSYLESYGYTVRKIHAESPTVHYILAN
jgi:FkbM family methyltransferase